MPSRSSRPAPARRPTNSPRGSVSRSGPRVGSARGPHGGYRLGRGTRLPPVVFTEPEAVGLVMAVLDGQPAAADVDDLVGSALGKVIRALPESVGRQAAALREHASAAPDRYSARPDPPTTSALVAAIAAPTSRAGHVSERVRQRVGGRGGPLGGRRPLRALVPPVSLPSRGRDPHLPGLPGAQLGMGVWRASDRGGRVWGFGTVPEARWRIGGRGGEPAGGFDAEWPGSGGPGCRRGERGGVGAAIVLRQDRAGLAGPVCHGASADPAPQERKMRDGDGVAG